VDGRLVRVAGAEDDAVVALPPFEGEARLAQWWSAP
jgi:hypothetical protein